MPPTETPAAPSIPPSANSALFPLLVPTAFGDCRPEDQIGRPLPGHSRPSLRRSVFGTSGRAQAWQGALEQWRQRPILGYGFGTEDEVFFDCFYVFQGSRPENSYLGTMLQLGLVGLVLLLAFLGSIAVPLARGLRRGGPRIDAVGAATAVVAAALVIGLVQSYLYSVGNVATLSVWLTALTGLALLASPGGRAHSVPQETHGVAAR
jgi:hypothetical protein